MAVTERSRWQVGGLVVPARRGLKPHGCYRWKSVKTDWVVHASRLKPAFTPLSRAFLRSIPGRQRSAALATKP
jgi:hypothetical protein